LCMVLTFSTTFGFAAESPVQDAAAEAAETPEEATVPEVPEAPDEVAVPDEGQPPAEEPAPAEAEAPAEEPAEEPAQEADVAEGAPEALAPEEEIVSQEAADAALPADSTKASSDKTVESISYTRAIPYVAWLESDFFYDEASGKYYVETTNYNLFNGDTLTVNYSDGSSVDYVYNTNDYCFVAQDGSGDMIRFGEGEGEVDYNFGDYTPDWELGGDNNYYGVTYQGATCLVTVEVKSTPVSSVTYEPTERYHVSGYDTFYSAQDGDKVIVEYKDGSAPETFVFSWDTKYTYDPAYGMDDAVGCYVSESDSSRKIPWHNSYDVFNVMSTNYDYETQQYYITYMGALDYAEGAAFIAQGFSFEQKTPMRFFEEEGYTMTDADGNEYIEYSMKRIAEGDKLTFFFKNDLGEERDITYTYDGWYFRNTEADITIDNYSFTVDMPSQYNSHLEIGKSYSYDLVYDYNDMHFRTDNQPFTIKVLPKDIIELDDPGTITGLDVSEVYDNLLIFDCDDYPDSEGNPPYSYQVAAVYNGETIYTATLNKTVMGGLRIYLNQLLPEMDAAAGNSYTVDFTFKAISADREIIAVSEPISYTFNINSVEKTLTSLDVPEYLNIGRGRWFPESLQYQITYNWSGEGMTNGAFQAYENNVGSITSITSSDTSIIKVDGTQITAVAKGTATITIKYTVNGAAKTKKATVTVRDQYIQIAFDEDGPIDYETLPAGVEKKLNLKAYLYKYNTTTKQFAFAGDVTDSTTFSYDSARSGIPGTSLSKDKLHVTVSGKTATVYTDLDVTGGYASLYFNATYGSSVTGDGIYYVELTSSSKLLYPNDDFLYPYPGKSKAMNVTYVKYENGEATPITDFELKVSFNDAEVTDVNGETINDDDLVSSDRLPLTIKNTASGDYSVSRVEVYTLTEDGYRGSWLRVDDNDIANNLNIKLAKTSVTYTGKAQKPAVTLTYDGETVPNTDFNIEYFSNTNAGKATVKVSDKEYSGYFTTAKFTIKPKAITPTVTLSATSYTYDGKVKKPTVTVKNGSTKLTTANYTVNYASGRKNVGSYKVTVKLKGNYSGSKVVTFKINPKGTTLKTLTATSKGFKATWNKQATKMSTSYITGYQIQYSTSSKFTTSTTKTLTVTKYSTVSKTVSKLVAKKKYYVRIRTYKTVSGTKYYSPWSASKYVTTKA